MIRVCVCVGWGVGLSEECGVLAGLYPNLDEPLWSLRSGLR